jgi:hypothetical protein
MIHIATLHSFLLTKLVRGYKKVLHLGELKLNIWHFANDGLYWHIDLLLGRQRTPINECSSSRINTVYRFSLNSLDLIYSI